MLGSVRTRFAFVSVSILSGLLVAACAGDDAGDGGGNGDSEDAHETATENLTSSEKQAICNAIPRPRAWTTQESDKMLSEVVRRVSELKRKNDQLIRDRGVGMYAGAGTEFWQAMESGNKTRAAQILQPKLKPGNDARTVAGEIKGTSCIGFLYTIMREVYATLDRSPEWAAIEKCGRAWDSDGLHVQQALIKGGWLSPSIGFISDDRKIPGGDSEVALHKEFLRSAAQGSYFGTPVSRTRMMKNFLPTPGSPTAKDETYFLKVGTSKTLAFGTFRGAFHTPFIVPAASIPADLVASSPSARAARDRGEPFVLESHRLRQPWDATNIEVRPLKEVMTETFSQSVTYATGTMLFAPGGEALLQ
jgi:hypothetical protein